MVEPLCLASLVTHSFAANFPYGPEAFFPLNTAVKDTSVKLLTDKLAAADKLSSNSFYSEFLSHEGFVFFKLSAS